MIEMKLCRYSLENGGANPVKMANALHKQLSELGTQEGPVPIADIAKALDIIEIRVERLTHIEGAVLMPRNKARGSILVNRAGKNRMRFTIAHELFHFLSPLHIPLTDFGFECSKVDLLTVAGKHSQTASRHQRQEAEANTFAAEVLVPHMHIRHKLLAAPNLKHVLDISSTFNVSKEAAARHYVHKHDEPIAIVFSKDGKVRYVSRSKECPWIDLAVASSLPIIPNGRADSSLSNIEDMFASDWVKASKDDQIPVQTLYQNDGYAMTLLIVPEDDEDLGLDDSYERFDR